MCPYNVKIIGQCSICGGNVVVPVVWWSVVPPQPYCVNCGATKRDDRPVIPMVPNPRRNIWTYNTKDPICYTKPNDIGDVHVTWC